MDCLYRHGSVMFYDVSDMGNLDVKSYAPVHINFVLLAYSAGQVLGRDGVSSVNGLKGL